MDAKYTSLQYVTAAGKPSQPLDLRTAVALLAAGTLQDTTLVWTDGMAQWTALGECRERFAWPSQTAVWTEAHAALVESRVAELRQSWDSLSDHDLLALLDELPDLPEDDVEMQWGRAYEKLMAAAEGPPEGVPPAGWEAKIEAKVGQLRCGWDSLPDNELLELLDELEPLGKTDEDEIGSHWNSVWTKVRAAEDEGAQPSRKVDFKSIVGLSSPPAPTPAPAAAPAQSSSAGWSAEELSLVAKRAAKIGVPYGSLVDDDLLDVLDLFEGKDETDLQQKWDAALDRALKPGADAAAAAAAVALEFAPAGAPARTDSAAALEELAAMSPLTSPKSAPIAAASPPVAALAETKPPARSLECKGYDGGYEGEPETQMVAWIEEVTTKSLGGDWVASLTDGVILCELCNALEPHSVSRINHSSQPFPQRENLQAAINAMRRFGVADKDNFDTADLHEQKNTRQVQIALLALGRAAYRIPGYEGPCVGKKPVAKAKKAKKHSEVKIDGLWGKAGGAAPQAGYTRPVGEIDRSTSVRPSQNANKVRYKLKKVNITADSGGSDGAATADGGGGGGGGGGGDDDSDAEIDFGGLDDLMDSSPVPGDETAAAAAADAVTAANADEVAAAAKAEAAAAAKAEAAAAEEAAADEAAAAAKAEAAAADEVAAAAKAEAVRQAAALEELRKQMAVEEERVAAMEQRAAELKRAAEAEATAIREAAVEQARLQAARAAAEAEAAIAAETTQEDGDEDVKAESTVSQPAEKPAEDVAEEQDAAAELKAAAEDAAEKAAAAAELKAAVARTKKKKAAACERPPPNPDWVRPASAPPTGPYPGDYDLEAPMDELACAWISEVSGMTATKLDDLRDGVTLCELCNVLVPGAVKRINRSAMPFPQVRLRRNITRKIYAGISMRHAFIHATEFWLLYLLTVFVPARQSIAA